METKLHSPEIECDGCANSIKKALGKLAGVQSVDVNVSDQDVFVRYDEAMTDRATLEAAMEKAGFGVR